MATDAAGNPRFVPTNSVPNVVGESYGWFIPVDESSRPVKWTETLTLPAPASSWSPGGSPPEGVSVSPDGRTVVVQGQGVPEHGLIFSFWEIAPGDPAGPHTILVKIEGGREERFSFTLVAAVSKDGGTPDSSDDMIHVLKQGTSEGPTTSDSMQQRIEAAAHEVHDLQAAGPRTALFDLTPPADAEEYRSLAGYGVLLVTAITQDASELPLKRVLFRGDRGADELQLLSAVRSTVKDPNVADVLGRYRCDAIYLFPMHLRHQTGQLLLDFATNRSGFVLANFPLSAERDKFPDSPPTAPSPPNQALIALLRRELPGFLESQASK